MTWIFAAILNPIRYLFVSLNVQCQHSYSLYIVSSDKVKCLANKPQPLGLNFQILLFGNSHLVHLSLELNTILVYLGYACAFVSVSVSVSVFFSLPCTNTTARTLRSTEIAWGLEENFLINCIHVTCSRKMVSQVMHFGFLFHWFLLLNYSILFFFLSNC